MQRLHISLNNPYVILIYPLGRPKEEVMQLKAVEVAMMGICAASYAVIGRLTDLGIVAPVVGVVAFWPAAVIPAIFAVLFGSWVGGIGAGIGIFMRDMLFHGDALLSLSAGVTSNFVAFFLIGYFSRRKLDWQKIVLGLGIGFLIVGLGTFVSTVFLPSESSAFTGLSPTNSMLLFVGVSAGSLILIGVIVRFWPEWKNYGIASVIGLGVGSTIIGFVLWLFSQFLSLPGGFSDAPTYFILLWIVWTFATEIPFLMAIGPPVLKACYKAFPSLAPQREE
jgi:uncharacterized membrane protein